MKLLILVSLTVFSTIGSWFGAAMEHGNWLSGWSILLGGAGGILGIYIGFKAGKYFLG